MSAVERRYQMTRLGKGDYLLPSNDGRTLWRVVSYTDGPSTGLEDWPRDRLVWGYYRWDGAFEDTESCRESIAEAIEMGGWSRWTFWAGPFLTRRIAVESALTERSA